MSSALLDLDPTGTLSAAGAAISLVGAALRLAPAVKNFKNSTGGGRSTSGPGGGSSSLHRSQTTPNEVPVAAKDPERERRAYETVNFVMREIGSQLCAAGLVDEHALTKALTSATQHIEVNLFSGEANRLFESLAPKLADPILVNSVFTSIYFIGALTAELSSSLPNYKDTYVPVGPRLVQQLFRAAIGEDAFRDNLTANLDAFKTLATTAGLLRPTDIGYSAFPGFPSFAPCKYSSKSFNDVRHNKSIYERLVKHFEKAGFPQPTPARQAEVGLIRDWRFLSGDSNSRAFDVDKADRNLGENFGRVLHWLICSAERLPPGQAVIAYYDQHTELIKWIQHRMGYAVLYPSVDLNLGGPHSQLDRKSRITIDSWVILMPSLPAQTAKRANAEHWMQSHLHTAAQAPPFAVENASAPRPVSQFVQQTNHAPPPANQVPPTAGQPNSPPSRVPSAASVPPSNNRASTVAPTSPPVSVASTPPMSPAAVEMPSRNDIQPAPKTIEQQIEGVHQHFMAALVPQCQRLWFQPSADAGIRDTQCNMLAHSLERETIDRLNMIQIPETHPARGRRKDFIDQAQELMEYLPVYKDLGLTATQGRQLPRALQGHTLQMPSHANTQTPATQAPHSSGSSPPPYSPTSPPNAGSSYQASAFPVPEKPKPTVIRRKAPPPPKKFIPAKALYDFEPDADNEEELGFHEDDEIEIIEKNATMDEDGWCRARVKGSKRIGLVPLEYLEIVETKPAPAPAPSNPSPAHSVQPSRPSGFSQATRPPMPPTPTSSYQPVGDNKPQSAPYVSEAQARPQGPQPLLTKSKIGKFEVAGLSVATIAAAAGVATLIQGAGDHSSGSNNPHLAAGASQHHQQRPDLTNQSDQNTTEDRSSPSGDGQNARGDQSTAPDTSNNNTIQAGDQSPVVDLSAFGEAPFAPQTPIAGPSVPITWNAEPYFVNQDPVAAQATDFADATDYTASTAGFGSTTTATDVTQDSTTIYDTAAPSISPFASLATTTTDTTTLTDATVDNGNGTTSTYESLEDEQTVSMTDGTDQTQWNATVEDDDDDSYAFDC